LQPLLLAFSKKKKKKTFLLCTIKLSQTAIHVQKSSFVKSSS